MPLFRDVCNTSWRQKKCTAGPPRSSGEAAQELFLRTHWRETHVIDQLILQISYGQPSLVGHIS